MRKIISKTFEPGVIHSICFLLYALEVCFLMSKKIYRSTITIFCFPAKRFFSFLHMLSKSCVTSAGVIGISLATPNNGTLVQNKFIRCASTRQLEVASPNCTHILIEQKSVKHYLDNGQGQRM